MPTRGNRVWAWHPAKQSQYPLRMASLRGAHGPIRSHVTTFMQKSCVPTPDWVRSRTFFVCAAPSAHARRRRVDGMTDERFLARWLARLLARWLDGLAFICIPGVPVLVPGNCVATAVPDAAALALARACAIPAFHRPVKKPVRMSGRRALACQIRQDEIGPRCVFQDLTDRCPGLGHETGNLANRSQTLVQHPA
jgi:hypothetical protein